MIEQTIRLAVPPLNIKQSPSGTNTGAGKGQVGTPQASQVKTTTAASPPLTDQAIASLLADIQASVAELQDQQRQSLHELQQAAVELSIAVASRLVHEKISTDDFAVEEIVGRVVEQIQPNGALTIRLHPQDIVVLENRTANTAPSWQALREIKFLPDASLRRGDCLVDAGDTGVLSAIAAQLSEIRCHLLEAIGDAQTERRGAQAADSSLRRFPDRRDTA